LQLHSQKLKLTVKQKTPGAGAIRLKNHSVLAHRLKSHPVPALVLEGKKKGGGHLAAPLSNSCHRG